MTLLALLPPPPPPLGSSSHSANPCRAGPSSLSGCKRLQRKGEHLLFLGGPQLIGEAGRGAICHNVGLCVRGAGPSVVPLGLSAHLPARLQDQRPGGTVLAEMLGCGPPVLSLARGQCGKPLPPGKDL